jgi:putative CocE/NonD family hydrolase
MGGGSGGRDAAGRLDHGGRWRSERDWPLPDTRWVPYYLGADRRLSASTAPGADATLTYDYDPHNPVPTIGGSITSGRPIMAGGAFDQLEGPQFFGSRPPYRRLAERPEVTGPISVRLWISSDCPDTDFTAKLIDVYPPGGDYPEGFAMNLTDGVLRARYRDSWERPMPLTPGQVYAATVELFPTSNLFRLGHRIRLDVSSSNFPRFDTNPNSGEPEGRAHAPRVARNSIYIGRAHPSHVLLPIIPARM